MNAAVLDNAAQYTTGSPRLVVRIAEGASIPSF